LRIGPRCAKQARTSNHQSLFGDFGEPTKPGLCQKTRLAKQKLKVSLCIPIVVRSTLVGQHRPWLARGRLQAKPKRLFFFVILVRHPKSYIGMTDRRDCGRKLSEWRWGLVLSWKIPEFCSKGNSIFYVL